MFYYRVTGIKKDNTTDTVYIMSIKELEYVNVLWYLNSIISDSGYADACTELIDKDNVEPGCLSDDVVLGGKFYDIRYRSSMGSTLHLCISGTSFPAEETIMKYNSYLSKYKQIEEIFSIEKISAAKVSMEYNNARKAITEDAIKRINSTREVWTFPKVWLVPYEMVVGVNGKYTV